MTLLLISPTMIHMATVLNTAMSSVALTLSARSAGYIAGALFAGGCINKHGRIERQFTNLCLLLAAVVSASPWFDSVALFVGAWAVIGGLVGYAETG